MLRRFIPLCIGRGGGPRHGDGAADRLRVCVISAIRDDAGQVGSTELDRTDEAVPVMGNIYYVGTVDLSSFLVTSSQGHVLIDTGVEENADAVLDNIRALGFDVKDIRVILTTQAHYDHVGGACTPEEGIGGQSPRVGLRRAARGRRGRGRLPLWTPSTTSHR